MDVSFQFREQRWSKKWKYFISLRNGKQKYLKLTFFLMYPRMSSGSCSQLAWNLSFTVSSLLVSWFFSCKPAAIRETGEFPGCDNTSERALRNSGWLLDAACSRKRWAASNSFLSVERREGKRKKERKKTKVSQWITQYWEQRNFSSDCYFTAMFMTFGCVRKCGGWKTSCC